MKKWLVGVAVAVSLMVPMASMAWGPVEEVAYPTTGILDGVWTGNWNWDGLGWGSATWTIDSGEVFGSLSSTTGASAGTLCNPFTRVVRIVFGSSAFYRGRVNAAGTYMAGVMVHSDGTTGIWYATKTSGGAGVATAETGNETGPPK